METNLIDIVICTNCSSTDCLENYPTIGQIICSKCGHEGTKIKLKVVGTSDEILDNCPYCGKEGEEDDTFLDTDGLIIFKCKKCGKLDGYKYAYGQDDPNCYGLDYDDQSYSLLQAKIAEQEGKHIFSDSKYRKMAKSLQKMQNTPYEKCKQLLKILINEKNQIIKSMGITEKTVTEAKQQAISFMASQKSLTERQLISLFSGAIMVSQEKLLRRSEIPKKETTERQLQYIFGIDRKTIRKWKRTLEEKLKHVKLGVSTRQRQSQRIYSMVVFPKQVMSIIKLDTPYKDICDFCERTELLTWRISYSNESWSDICTFSYDRLKDMSLDNDWEIEKRIFPH
jgi:hypothetical protein